MFKILILMFVYNEGENFRKVVIEIMKELKGLDYEIIIINDGFRDNIFEVVREFCELFRNV